MATNLISDRDATRAPLLKSAGGLGVSLLVVFVAAAFGAQFGPDTWNAGLDKPPLNPPGWVFGPVWTILYVLMAIAAWLIWLQRPQQGISTALTLYGGQLILNACWSPLFFGMHRPGLALLDLIALWLVLAATLVAFWRVRPVAGALLAPYLVWVSFAGYLNAVIWWLNRG